jgi:hypothetical protein
MTPRHRVALEFPEAACEGHMLGTGDVLIAEKNNMV